MIIELLLPSILAGLSIAAAGGVLGCFVVWRRLAFFGDTLAHSAILGISLALLAKVDPLIGLLGFGSVVALVMARFERRLKISSDTLLAIIAQTSLAAGMLVLPLTGTNINIEAVLFGDILAVAWSDVIVTGVIALTIIALIAGLWRPLVTLSIDEELAATEGVPTERLKMLTFLMLVSLVAIAVQLVGVLLVSALLLIPAACSRTLAPTPLTMVILAPFIGMLAVLIGLSLSFYADTSAGPSIVLTASIFWLLANLLQKLRG
ncbi:High-affinity zinc uptake system membrane protein ZnuB [BD1-7 clade bacterium]|uniref:High-affinity zinc uptake system membrane protein ZnuB n=1 Tax=BD1-7 clade bacterium TaxID=2029982 RepID=A0A5S9N1C5_9GAMM|nr:High-affinity zinc uptake system membrane protein ZnuB [BD1-7 clade bacterium]CAA0083645.1 High-affinity zinc uptake system membrane protein ZnuB [BD1-7 clade bacterium]